MTDHKFRYSRGERVALTFKEGLGEVGEVVDVGFTGKISSTFGRYEYVSIRLDSTGNDTGPMPITCVMPEKTPPGSLESRSAKYPIR